MLKQVTLRTPEMQERYMKYLKEEYDGSCIFCTRDLLIKEYNHWILLWNRFPYNRVYTNHRMLATKRHTADYLNRDEQEELRIILETENYNQCILNKRENRSLPLHFHYHLVDIKELSGNSG